MNKLLFAWFLLFGLHGLSGAASVELITDKDTYLPGEIIQVSIELKDFSETQGGGVNLSFTNTRVVFNEQAIDSIWTFVTQLGSLSPDGWINDILFTSFNGLSGDIPAATLQFEAQNTGVVDFELTESDISPFAGNGVVITPDFIGKSIKIIPQEYHNYKKKRSFWRRFRHWFRSRF